MYGNGMLAFAEVDFGSNHDGNFQQATVSVYLDREELRGVNDICQSMGAEYSLEGFSGFNSHNFFQVVYALAKNRSIERNPNLAKNLPDIDPNRTKIDFSLNRLDNTCTIGDLLLADSNKDMRSVVLTYMSKELMKYVIDPFVDPREYYLQGGF